MTYSKSFTKAFKITAKNEGLLSNDALDPGGLTYRGISRTYWPSWQGWPLVDRLLINKLTPTEVGTLDFLVTEFYWTNFWNRVIGERVALISQDIANELFDTAVNMGVHQAVKFLQEALNLLNLNQKIYRDIVVDGWIGEITLEALNHYAVSRPPPKDTAIGRLLRVMNTLQGSLYISLMRKYPERELFRGWFDRI